MKGKFDFAKQLRANLTDAEKFIWQFLRRKQLDGFKFRKQVPIGTYVVDFACLEVLVVIELDGGQHMEDSQYDAKRDQWLQKEGYKVLRFWNNEVFKDIENILETILKTCQGHPPPNLLPSREEE